MTLSEQAMSIRSYADLVAFLAALARDAEDPTSDWAHTSVEGYLGAVAACVANRYQSGGESVPDPPAYWRFMGELFLSGKYYE
ncbi:MAG TPA: hypothetical protein VII06_35965 [Chloroflexota bacterium]|jgi:hypothetical protein